MARQASALPKIPVKTERVTKRLGFYPDITDGCKRAATF